MSFFYPGTFFILSGIILMLIQGSGSPGPSGFNKSSVQEYVSVSPYPVLSDKPKGYRGVVGYNDGFIATGSGGRIDLLSSTGRIIKSQKSTGVDFNCVASTDKMIITAGEKGVLRISSDGNSYSKIDTGTDKDINSLAIFNRLIIATADQGLIISGYPGGSFIEKQLNIKGNIVSVSASLSDCYGVTDEGEIIHSTDGTNWSIFDFNQFYSGYYKPCHFTCVLVTDDRIAVAGVRSDSTPVMIFSTQGNVWTERELYYTDEQGVSRYLEGSPMGISYNGTGDEFYLSCTGGKLMKIPSCSQCNEVAEISSADLTGISISGNNLIIVGEDFFIWTLNQGF